MTERHHCPPWCHECPEIDAIVRERGEEPGPEDFMPWCLNGIQIGLDACCCSHEDPLIDQDAIARANWYAAERIRCNQRTTDTYVNDELRKRRLERKRTG